jgi:hypothetical protein
VSDGKQLLVSADGRRLGYPRDSQCIPALLIISCLCFVHRTSSSASLELHSCCLSHFLGIVKSVLALLWLHVRVPVSCVSNCKFDRLSTCPLIQSPSDSNANAKASVVSRVADELITEDAGRRKGGQFARDGRRPAHHPQAPTNSQASLPALHPP